MNLKEAFEALLAGKKIRYKNAEPDTYIYMEDEGLYNNYNVRIGMFDVWTEYEEYIKIEYVNFYKAMAHIVSGGRAKRKNFDWSIYIDFESELKKIKVYDNNSIYEVTKNDIVNIDWILL